MVITAWLSLFWTATLPRWPHFSPSLAQPPQVPILGPILHPCHDSLFFAATTHSECRAVEEPRFGMVPNLVLFSTSRWKQCADGPICAFRAHTHTRNTQSIDGLFPQFGDNLSLHPPGEGTPPGHRTSRVTQFLFPLVGDQHKATPSRARAPPRSHPTSCACCTLTITLISRCLCLGLMPGYASVA